MKGDCEKWLSCPQCKKYAIPSDQHVGDVFESGTCVTKPVSQWNMKLPNAVASLANRYERGQVSLCGLFSTVVKDAGMSRFSHVQGEVNSLGKLDRHYYGMFGFLASKDEGIWIESPNPESSLRIKGALKWFRTNNKLYSDFFCEYETLFRFAKPAFINPVLLEKQSIPLDRLLEEEAVGMAFPIDATYFDQFPLIFDEGLSDIAGRQNPRLKVSQDKLKELTKARYGDHNLEAKTFPHLHPWGFGG